MKYIIETPVYCDKEKVWRILNVLTGTVYSSLFVDRETAFTSIEDGTKRAGRTVKAASIENIVAILDMVA